MEINITSMKILTQFFKSPTRKFYPRELSRILRINHVTITQHLKKLDKLGLLHSEESNLAKTYSIVISRESQNLKLYYNLEKIRTSGIIDDLQKGYDFPVIIVFGSYAKAADDEGSDVDICVLTDIKKEFDASRYEKDLERKVSIHKFSNNEWETAIIKNPHLINSICNGIVLSGELEVIK